MSTPLQHTSSIFKIKILFLSLPFVVIVNLSQLPSIRQEAGKRWGALYRIDHQDVFDESNLKKFAQFYSRTNVFYEIGRRFPDSILFVSKDNIFLESNYFISNVKILGKIKKIYLTDFNGVLGLSDLSEKNLRSSDYIYISEGDQINGVTRIRWTIFYKKKATSKFIFQSNTQGTEWAFIDTELLASSIKEHADD